VAAGVGVAQGAGVALGQVLAGALGASYGWRLPFVVVAVPALALAGAVGLLVEEPRRGAQEAALGGERAGDGEYAERIEWAKVRHIFAIRTNLCAFAQGIPGCVPWGLMNTFFADYMAQDRRLGVPAATTLVVVFGAGSVLGSLAGGAGGQALYNRSPGLLGLLMATTTALWALPLLYIVNTSALRGDSVLAFLAGALSCVTGTNVRAVLLGVNAPETRGTVFAIFNLMDGLGKGLGPAAVASLIAAHGRRYAFNVGISLWFLAALFLAGIAATLGRDEAALAERLAAVRAAAAADDSEEAVELAGLLRGAQRDDTR
jgi:predicted MFS family arabinose efflux permease